MACVSAVNTYISNTFSKRDLIKTDRAGNVTPFFNGSTLTLSFENGKYTVTIDKTGEVIDRGKTTNCIRSVYSARFKPDYVIDEGKEYSYADFTEIYDSLEDQRQQKVKYKAYFIQNEGETGVGIVKYSEDKTYAIASIYDNEAETNRQAFGILERYLHETLDLEEFGFARIGNLNVKKSFFENFIGAVYFQKESNGNKFNEVEQLAADAIKRKSTILENFGDEGLPSNKIKKERAE
ncbi:hypothetical protein [Paraliobacillus salinarum]|uniref:hypothetical protein n=1 Tax=Paraliobacillus salinarum TaxID=1158996 RepID=UPI0015F3AFD7|nr:hypothetical protein [Paraliobacillus salinarum]